ncbi:MAG TPA: FGGY family carbohydrate kinase, partial [Cyclobacteriaceae bacterium]|nr:FGGY family carbohydrate kinase [Cyclobacteriaceae bacterium]
MNRYLLGYDLGSSSVKASLLEVESGRLAGSVTAPQQEMEIASPRHGWAEQDPEAWWTNLVLATRQLLSEFQIEASAIQAIGISYQMHGLVLVDKNQQVL